MKSIIIISHFLSCNYGDRIQSYNLVERLNKLKVPFTLVNLFPLDNGIDCMEDTSVFDNKVYSYSYVFKKMNSIDNIIMFTGSIGSDKLYHKYCKQLLGLVNNIFIIIGGFSSDVISYESLDYLFMSKKVLFISRTYNELKLFKLMGNVITKNNIVSKYHHGGDIIINVLSHYINYFKAIRKKESKFNKVAILSNYLLENMKKCKKMDLLNRLIEKTDKIILIDTYEDKEVLNYLKSINSKVPVVLSYNIDTILSNLINTSVVISCRLHGAVFTCVLGIPTYILPIDNSSNFNSYIPTNNKELGSFKYHSFIKSALENNVGFGRLIRYEDLETFDYGSFPVDNLLIEKYKKMCMDTEEAIIRTIL